MPFVRMDDTNDADLSADCCYSCIRRDVVLNKGDLLKVDSAWHIHT